MTGPPRMTMQTKAVLTFLLREPTQDRYGLEICDSVGLPTGTIYPILARLEQAGWVESRWEDADAHPGQGRPHRRYYRLSSEGAELARHALAATRQPKRSAAWRTRPGVARG